MDDERENKEKEKEEFLVKKVLSKGKENKVILLEQQVDKNQTALVSNNNTKIVKREIAFKTEHRFRKTVEAYTFLMRKQREHAQQEQEKLARNEKRKQDKKEEKIKRKKKKEKKKDDVKNMKKRVTRRKCSSFTSSSSSFTSSSSCSSKSNDSFSSCCSKTHPASKTTPTSSRSRSHTSSSEYGSSDSSSNLFTYLADSPPIKPKFRRTIKIFKISESCENVSIEHEFVEGISLEPNSVFNMGKAGVVVEEKDKEKEKQQKQKEKEKEKEKEKKEKKWVYEIEDIPTIISDVGHQICWLHSQKVVHFDIKPHNIVWDGTHATLIDYDYLLPFDPESKKEIVLGLRGTPNYISPELLTAKKLKERDLDCIDLYAFGVTLYVLLTRQAPYPGAVNVPQVYRYIKAGPPDLARAKKALDDHAREKMLMGLQDGLDERARAKIMDILALLLNQKDPPERRKGLFLVLSFFENLSFASSGAATPFAAGPSEPLGPLIPLQIEKEKEDENSETKRTMTTRTKSVKKEKEPIKSKPKKEKEKEEKDDDSSDRTIVFPM